MCAGKKLKLRPRNVNVMAMWITTIKHIFPKGTEILFLAHLVVSKWAFLSNLINAILSTFANIKWWCLSCIFWGNGPGLVAGFESAPPKSGWNLLTLDWKIHDCLQQSVQVTTAVSKGRWKAKNIVYLDILFKYYFQTTSVTLFWTW